MAIALDTSSSGNQEAGTSVSYSYTVTGSNPVFIAAIMASSARTISNVTYGGVAMTLAGSRSTGTQPVAIYYITGITGANTFSASIDSSSFIYTSVASYTGVNQATPIDPGGSATANGSGTSTSVTGTVTTTADNAWTIMGVRTNSSGDSSASTGATQRVTNTGHLQLYDSNAAITPAGSTSMTVTMTNQAYEYSIITIQPATASTSHLLACLGAGA